MKRERQRSFKRKPDVLSTAMAVSSGSDHLNTGNRHGRKGSLRKQVSDDPQFASVHETSMNSLFPTSPPTRTDSKHLRRSGSVSATITGSSNNKRTRAGSVRHHSTYYQSSPRVSNKSRLNRGGSTSSDPTGGAGSPGTSGDLPLTPQLSPRLMPPQKSTSKLTSALASPADGGSTHPDEDTSLIELQRYIEQHPG